jgi:F-box protein, helicase, 18
MPLTDQQQEIIQSSGNLKINAVAGSGKTTTLLNYAKQRKNSSLLYLAFNKTVRQEATTKFNDQNLTHIKAETAHSLAYRHIIPKYRYQIKQQGYKAWELAQLLKIDATNDKLFPFIAANHIARMTAQFCNSRHCKVQDIGYLASLQDPESKSFVELHYDFLVHNTRKFLGGMNDGTWEVLHDFYLKKFHLEQNKLPYDYILFDEAQDASPAMLDAFLQQPAHKIMVGDTHQQIYSWRYAVNSLEQVDFPTKQLSESFRFGPEIALLAKQILGWKQHFGQMDIPSIKGNGPVNSLPSEATIARTNLGLLLKAVDFITAHKKSARIYFEGSLASYTYADEGASLYYILHLSNSKHHNIRDSLIKQMKSIDELEEYVTKTEDSQLSMMMEMVKEYGNEISALLQKLRNQNLPPEEKSKADMIFSTVHRSKGMEYHTVHLAPDFVNEERLKKMMQSEKSCCEVKLAEEVNLLYVALTRASHRLKIPQSLHNMPYAVASPIQVMADVSKELKDTNHKQGYFAGDLGKPSSIRGLPKPKDAAKPWTADLDASISRMFYRGSTIEQMANHFRRTKGAIISRLRKLELE